MDTKDDTKMFAVLNHIAEQVGKMSGMLESVLSQLADHARRIRDLELAQKSHEGNGCQVECESHLPANALSKDTLIKYLIYGILGCIATIVTLTGSASLLKYALTQGATHLESKPPPTHSQTSLNRNERKGRQHGDQQTQTRLEVYYRRRIWRPGLCA